MQVLRLEFPVETIFIFINSKTAGAQMEKHVNKITDFVVTIPFDINNRQSRIEIVLVIASAPRVIVIVVETR